MPKERDQERVARQAILRRKRTLKPQRRVCTGAEMCMMSPMQQDQLLGLSCSQSERLSLVSIRPQLTRSLLSPHLQRKCDSTDINSHCGRCVKQSLECEYKKHNRGRKKQLPPSSEPVASSSQPSLPQPPPSTAPSFSNPQAPSQSNPTSLAPSPNPPPNPPPSLSAPAAPPAHQSQVDGSKRRQVSFSHVIPNEGDSSRTSRRCSSARSAPALPAFICSQDLGTNLAESTAR